MPIVIERYLPAQFLDELGTLRTRADHAHVTPDDIEHLGQLIDPEAPQDPASARDPVIAGRRPAWPGVTLGIDTHAAELVEPDDATVPPYPGLAIEDRCADTILDDDGKHGQRLLTAA